MPINQFRTTSDDNEETMFILRDPDHLYIHSEVVDILNKAEALGFSIDKGSELENMTVREVDVLVNRKQ